MESRDRFQTRDLGLSCLLQVCDCKEQNHQPPRRELRGKHTVAISDTWPAFRGNTFSEWHYQKNYQTAWTCQYCLYPKVRAADHRFPRTYVKGVLWNLKKLRPFGDLLPFPDIQTSVADQSVSQRNATKALEGRYPAHKWVVALSFISIF